MYARIHAHMHAHTHAHTHTHTHQKQSQVALGGASMRKELFGGSDDMSTSEDHVSDACVHNHDVIMISFISFVSVH